MNSNMDSNGTKSAYEDKWDAEGGRRSLQSAKKSSGGSLRCQDGDNNEENADKTRTWLSDSDQDQRSDVDGRRSTPSFYSDEYDSPSEDSRSPYSQSRIPSHSPQRRIQAKTTSSTPINKKGYLGRPGAYGHEHPTRHLLSQQHRKGVRSQTKEYTPCKDLDMATKRLLSTRLLKINELKNALVELQQQHDNIQLENRTLRQVQARLQHHNDTESQLAQLMLRHSNETHVYHERLRRCHEQVRALEQKLKDKEEQLQKEQSQLKKSRASITRLKRLLAQEDLETRDELSRKLEKEKSRAQVAEEKLKEVEHSKELSNNLYERQLAAERRKTVSVLEENQAQQQMLEELTRKLRKKERELDAMNIYANRVVKSSLRKETESTTKLKVSSRNSTKAAEPTRRTSTPDFPTPPPAVTDTSAFCEQSLDEYLSLKKLHRGDKPTKTEDRNEKEEEQKVQDKEKDDSLGVKEQEKEEKQQTFQANEPKKVSTPAQRSEIEESRVGSLLSQEEADQIRHGRVQEQATNWIQEALMSQNVVEVRRKKDHLLAKMREIDDQIHVRQQAALETEQLSPAPADAGAREGRRSGMESAARGAGRRALQSPNTGDDLLFGNYAPSFINPNSRRSLNLPAAAPAEKRNTVLETVSLLNSRGEEVERRKVTEHRPEEDRKSNFLQQLFGPIKVADNKSIFDNVDADTPPPATYGTRSTRERPFNFSPPESTANSLHAAQSGPSIRAFTSFDADIEEITL
ncbi:hypothetical protein fugu_017759 [Takifugu bimaculatus]|uniref:Lebercilin domain-containing protein n=1 Tax=Takifugu bimaculatus TaxID=433685 RepID=A0A4Z2BUI5_9TELE|nr:hypothetical protein fugu_017759 [Takifugu bimaculatus]